MTVHNCPVLKWYKTPEECHQTEESQDHHNRATNRKCTYVIRHRECLLGHKYKITKSTKVGWKVVGDEMQIKC